VLGRSFTPEENTAWGSPVVILSDTLWRRCFGGDPGMIGRVLKLGGQSRTVVGIMPPGFRFPGESDLWLPHAFNARLNVSVIARLKPDVTPDAARAELSVILDQKRQAFPDRDPDVQIRVVGMSEWFVGNVRWGLLILFGAVVFVKLIACANVANLLLARTAARQKEMAIRAALGAGRLRLVRQLLTESLLLSLAGGASGLLLTKWGINLFVAMSPSGIARIGESDVDGRVLGFTCMVSVLTGLIAGIFPALQASKTNINETLKGESTTGAAWSGHGSGQRSLTALMIAELALAMVLLVGAGLLIKSFQRLLAVPTGFNPDGVLTLQLSPSFTTYPDDFSRKFMKYPPGSPQRAAYIQAVRERVQALPGIQSVSLTGFLPLAGPNITAGLSKVVEGRPPFEPGKGLTINVNHITSDYFQTMGIEMRAGRPFDRQDGSEAPQVAIINETMARRLFSNESPIGHRLVIKPTPRTIVGVVGDTRHFGSDRDVNAEVYLPYSQPFLQNANYVTYLTLAARVAPDQTNPKAYPLWPLPSTIRCAP
jgi:putative ABC transport system permease protein